MRILSHNIRVGPSFSKNVFFLNFLQSKPGICFLFHLMKALFILKIFVLTFSDMLENGLIRNLRLISKFMMSRPGKRNNYDTHIA